LEEQQDAAHQEHGPSWLTIAISDYQAKDGNEIDAIAEVSEEGSRAQEDARSKAETMPVPEAPGALPAPEPSVPDPMGSGGDAAGPGVTTVSLEADAAEDTVMSMPAPPTITALSTAGNLIPENTGRPGHPSYGSAPSPEAPTPLAATSTVQSFAVTDQQSVTAVELGEDLATSCTRGATDVSVSIPAKASPADPTPTGGGDAPVAASAAVGAVAEAIALRQ
jgi:hypothetical protein